MELAANSCAQTSVAFLRQLRARYPGPLIVIWDNGPAHGGDALRAFLATPGLDLRLVRLPAYSPDYNADEAIWGWVREEVTANTCFGTAANVRAHVDAFFRGLRDRADEVKTRCRTVLHADARALQAATAATCSAATAATPTLGALLHDLTHLAQELTTQCAIIPQADDLALAGV
jgi:transposase